MTLTLGQGCTLCVMTTTPAIEIAGLTKSYGMHLVLRVFDLSFPAGTFFALLGSNSASNTTLVKILSTFLKFDDGTASGQGYEVDTVHTQFLMST